MNKLVLSGVATALALCASSAFAHGHLVTGPELYATPADSQAAQAPQPRVPAHHVRVIRHTTSAPSESGAS